MRSWSINPTILKLATFRHIRVPQMIYFSSEEYDHGTIGEKTSRQSLCNFLLVCRIIILMFFFYSQEDFLSFKIFCRPYTCIGEEIDYKRCKKSHLYISVKMKTKNMQEIAKCHIALEKK